MKKIFKITIAIATLVVCNADATPAWCVNALSLTEVAICEDSNLSSMDEKLAIHYKYQKSNPGIKQSQREWLKQRNKCKSDISCIRDLYDSRISVLENPVEVAKTEPKTESTRPKVKAKKKSAKSDKMTAKECRKAQYLLDDIEAQLVGLRIEVALIRNASVEQMDAAYEMYDQVAQMPDLIKAEAKQRGCKLH